MRRLRLNESYKLEVSKEEKEKRLESTEGVSKKGGSVIANLAAIHAGTTANYTVYGADKLRGDEAEGTGVASWTNPYNKPVLTHHDKHSDPIGRVESASYMTAGSKPFIKLKVKISDESAAEKVLDGRYDTVSIGSETDAAICSICGTDIVEEGFCGHWRGETYEGETAKWILGDLWFNEVSYVNVPADKDAGTLSKERLQESADYNIDTVESLGDGTAVLIVGSEETEESKNKKNTASVQYTIEESKEGDNTLPEGKENEKTVAELQEELDSLQESHDELEESNKDLEGKLETLKEEKQDLETEKEKLMENVEEKTDKLHDALSQRIVDMRTVLGKPMEEERDDEVEKYASRSFESLNDTMGDLVLEYKDALPGLRGQIEKVNNPGAAVNDGKEPNSSIEGVEEKDDDEDVEMTEEEINKKTEDVLKNLFGGTN